VKAAFENASRLLSVWTFAFAVETLAVALWYRPAFAGAWELTAIFAWALPLVVALACPAALLLGFAQQGVPERFERFTVGVVSALGFGVLAYILFAGRRASAAQVPATLFAVAAGAGFAYVGFPHIRKIGTFVWGIASCAAWLGNVLLLKGLYPALHVGLSVVSLLLLWPLAASRGLRLFPRAPAAALAVTVAVGALWAPRKLAPLDNVRVLLLEHAPFAGRAVMLASRAEVVEPSAVMDGHAALGTGASAFDFRGRDILFITVDALRADHVGSYGYARDTTPEIDALAAQGIRYEHAYCATPHTSYSVTSMMTGKYMRPLLQQGTAQDSETLASILRTYEYHTAAFYPPAVFFVDERNFEGFKNRTLDFEYAKVEFTKPELRLAQIRKYVESAPKDAPLLLWVHMFEPHEPYEAHDGISYGAKPIDAYDGEVHVADRAVGDTVRLFEQLRGKSAVVVVSADHGEEFGEHGGRYHGTTVYEEQVRVPLILRAAGVAPRVVKEPVQTIDILPTLLAGLHIPVPPRVRGRDLGTAQAPDWQGEAFVESEEQALLATGTQRLVCNRALGACRVHDIARDAAQLTSVENSPNFAALKTKLRSIERAHGLYEGASGGSLPDALRQGLAGNKEAAPEVAELLDDARVEVRRKAARVLLRLRASESVPALVRASAREEDLETKAFASLAAVRLSALSKETAAGLLVVQERPEGHEVAFWAALVLAELGDARGERELTSFLKETRELGLAKEILLGLGKIRSLRAVPVLLERLSDVRLRPYVATCLGEIGDKSARPRLREVFATERYMQARLPEANALLALGEDLDLEPSLTNFAGMPEVFPQAFSVASRTTWLAKRVLALDKDGKLRTRVAAGRRVLVEGAPERFQLNGSDALSSLKQTGEQPRVRQCDVLESTQLALEAAPGAAVRLWIVPLTREIPPPAPVSP
jgi:arylsulfatase A-like enzyme/HEAT repeat protein